MKPAYKSSVFLNNSSECATTKVFRWRRKLVLRAMPMDHITSSPILEYLGDALRVSMFPSGEQQIKSMRSDRSRGAGRW